MTTTAIIYYIILLLCSWGPLLSVYKTIKGDMVPNRVTYFLWFFSSMIAFASQVVQGVTLTSALTFLSGFLPFCVFVASFFQKDKKVWKLSLFDWACGGVALLGLFLWYVTNNPNAALLFAILADLMSALPTVRKLYVAPETEFPIVFLPGAIAALVTTYVAPAFVFEHIGFSLYIVFLNTTMMIVGFSSKYFKKKNI